MVLPLLKSKLKFLIKQNFRIVHIIGENNFNNYGNVIRLCNSIGPPLTNAYSPSHWLSICNKFAFKLFFVLIFNPISGANLSIILT